MKHNANSAVFDFSTIAPTRTGEGAKEAEKMIAVLFRQDFKLNKESA